MDILIKVAQLVLSLSILIVLHELGHFIPAKLFGTRVEKFYLFFDPWFSLFKVKKGDTEYGIGWLPLGGYVKIAGMVDESMDKEFLNTEPQPWEFRSKPAWQRLIIMIGGVTVNFILGFVIFAFTFMYYGDPFVPTKALKDGISVTEMAEKAGFQNGDHILSYGGKSFDKFQPNLLVKDIILENVRDIKVQRNNQDVTFTIPESVVSDIKANQKASLGMIGPRLPTIVAAVGEGTPAAQAKLQPEDKIIGVNQQPLMFHDELMKELSKHKGQEVTLTILRNNVDTVFQPIGVTTEGKLGFAPYGAAKFFEMERDDYTFMEAIPAGISKGINFLGDQISAFGQMFKGEIKASESLGGFASITNLFPSSWDWEIFWKTTAVLSLILGFMNILPIPALDGGYIMFLIWEVITGKKVSDKVMGIATTIGMLLLFSLLIYANGLDIFRALK